MNKDKKVNKVKRVRKALVMDNNVVLTIRRDPQMYQRKQVEAVFAWERRSITVRLSDDTMKAIVKLMEADDPRTLKGLWQDVVVVR